MSESLDHLAPNLVAIRARRKLTQANAADTIGCSSVTLSNWERGACIPSLASIRKLSAAYGVSIDRLVSAPIQRVRLQGTKKGAAPMRDAAQSVSRGKRGGVR